MPAGTLAEHAPMIGLTPRTVAASVPLSSLID